MFSRRPPSLLRQHSFFGASRRVTGLRGSVGISQGQRWTSFMLRRRKQRHWPPAWERLSCGTAVSRIDPSHWLSLFSCSIDSPNGLWGQSPFGSYSYQLALAFSSLTSHQGEANKTNLSSDIFLVVLVPMAKEDGLSQANKTRTEDTHWTVGSHPAAASGQAEVKVPTPTPNHCPMTHQGQLHGDFWKHKQFRSIRLRNSRGRKKKTINRNYKENVRDMTIERELLISR